MTDDLYDKIDEAMLPFHQHIEDMLEIDGEALDEEKGIKMQIEEVGIESPVQLEIVIDDDGKIVVGSSPPLYYLSTGIMPVFHKLTLRAVAVQQNSTT